MTQSHPLPPLPAHKIHFLFFIYFLPTMTFSPPSKPEVHHSVIRHLFTGAPSR